MDARFAGAQRVAERRRRRLAIEGEEPGTAQPASLAAKRVDGAAGEDGRHAVSPLPALPLATIVPRAWWKHAAVDILLALVALALSAGAARLQQVAAALGGEAASMLQPSNPVLARWYSGTLLLLTGQMALLVWWARSQSAKDFSGRYRFWLRAAGCWLALNLCAATGLHKALAETVANGLPVEYQRHGMALWWVPTAIVAMTMAAGLRKEVRLCRPAKWLMCLGAACYAAASAVLWQPRWSVEGVSPPVATMGLAMLGHVCLLSGVWAFARHVIHVSADPPAILKRRMCIPRPHFRLKGRKQAPAHDEAVHQQTSAPAADGPNGRRRGRKTTEREVAVPTTASEETSSLEPIQDSRNHSGREPAVSTQPSASAAPPAREAGYDHQPAGDQPARPQPSSPLARQPVPVVPPSPAPPTLRLADPDEFPDDAGKEPDEPPGNLPGRPDLRGLSKKQRRKAIQEWRERQRRMQRE